MNRKTDVRVTNECNLYLFHLLTDAAQAWVDANVSDEHTSWGDALVVEHRYARTLTGDMRADGLTVEYRNDMYWVERS